MFEFVYIHIENILGHFCAHKNWLIMITNTSCRKGMFPYLSVCMYVCIYTCISYCYTKRFSFPSFKDKFRVVKKPDNEKYDGIKYDHDEITCKCRLEINLDYIF
jgi:hypothetical protein